MPELPEVETTKKGITPHTQDVTIQTVIINNPNLRWPVDRVLAKALADQTIHHIQRRGKYLIFICDYLDIILHLGMSGSLRVATKNESAKKHDHIQILLKNKHSIIFNDPRRFGCFIITPHAFEHKLITKLGVEPLSSSLNANYLQQQASNKKVNIKQFIMNSHILVGVGNIYANEALFLSGIHPLRAANTLSQKEYLCLVHNIKKILRAAIKQGGTTLKDFTNAEGKPGYFQQTLNVYGRTNQPCNNCGTLLSERRINGRNTVFCSNCQS